MTPVLTMAPTIGIIVRLHFGHTRSSILPPNRFVIHGTGVGNLAKVLVKAWITVNQFGPATDQVVIEEICGFFEGVRFGGAFLADQFGIADGDGDKVRCERRAVVGTACRTVAVVMQLPQNHVHREDDDAKL